MKRKTKIPLTLLACAGIIAAFFISRNRFNDEEESGKFPPYKDINIPIMTLEGEDAKFSLGSGKIKKNGEEILASSQDGERVVKLALFYQSLKENPLLFDPNLDIEEFEKTLVSMDKVNAEFDEKTGWGQANPMIFLRALLESSRMWNDFSQDVSEKNAQMMISKIKQAQESYSSEAYRIGKKIEDAVANGAEGGIVMFLGGETKASTGLTARDFKKMQENGQLLKAKITELEECLNLSNCRRPLPQLSKLDIEKKQDDGLLPDILPFEKMGVKWEAVENVPLVIHSRCWKSRGTNIIFPATRCLAEKGYCTDWSMLSDGVYYSWLPETSKGKKLLEQGIGRGDQSGTATYACQDMTYAPKVWTMLHLLKDEKPRELFSQNVPLLNSEFQKELDEIWRRGNIAEKNFFEAQHPSDWAMEDVANQYVLAYNFLAKNNISNDRMSDEFLRRSNLIKGKISKINLLFNRHLHTIESYSDSLNPEMMKFERPEYVFNIKSLYSLTFLNFSPFVWVSEENPEYMIQVGKDEREEIINRMGVGKAPVIRREEAASFYGEDKLEQWKKMIQKYYPEGQGSETRDY